MDCAEPEVMLELEVLEVSSSDLYEIGVRWPDAVSYSLVGSGGTPGTVTLREWQNRSSDIVRMTVTNPFLAFNLRNQLGRSNILANPRIRVRNKEKAKVHIGDRVPVITSTSTATGFLSESVAYLDVGLKLDVEPTIHLDGEVAIKISLEVSNIVREIQSPTGTLTYQVGTRNAATTLRLKDGQTQILAGLISDEDRKTVSQIPGLGDLPVLGRLFGSHLDQANKTEIVLLITPHIVRNLARPEARFSEFPSGTDAAIGAAPLRLRQGTAGAKASPVAAFASPAVAAPAATGRITLQAPTTATPGKQFELQVIIDTPTALRRGSLDFAFDPSRLKFVRGAPGALVTAADKEATFRAQAPEAVGRLNIDFAVVRDLRGKGELARLTFEVLGTAAGTPRIRLEAASLAGPAGQAISSRLPPAVAVSVIRQ